MTVLLVDDDQDDQDIFKEAASLAIADIHCLFAKDGEECLALLETLSALPDYLFLDVNMPRMDGRECLKRLKAHPRFKKISVIMYSTSNYQSGQGEYLKLGASSFITKPSEFNLLITYLKSVLQ
jgi:CheY-like chemotaxis protein